MIFQDPGSGVLQHKGSIRMTNGGGSGAATAAGLSQKASNKRKRSTDRTTRLLIAILILFLLTEFPQVRRGDSDWVLGV